jgi:hypothetical protein
VIFQPLVFIPVEVYHFIEIVIFHHFQRFLIDSRVRVLYDLQASLVFKRGRNQKITQEVRVHVYVVSALSLPSIYTYTKRLHLYRRERRCEELYRKILQRRPNNWEKRRNRTAYRLLIIISLLLLEIRFVNRPGAKSSSPSKAMALKRKPKKKQNPFTSKPKTRKTSQQKQQL